MWCSRLRVRGDGKEAGAHVIADLDDLRGSNGDAARVLEFGRG